MVTFWLPDSDAISIIRAMVLHLSKRRRFPRPHLYCECGNLLRIVLPHKATRLTCFGSNLDIRVDAKCPSCDTIKAVHYSDLHYSIYPDSIPGQLSEDLVEATICLFAGAYKACGVMCRRIIQRTAMMMGAKAERNARLADQIDELFRRNRIPQQLQERWHHIRRLGNLSAHPIHIFSVPELEISELEADVMVRWIEEWLVDFFKV